MMLSIDPSHVLSQPAELAVSKLCQWPLFCPELKEVQIVILCEFYGSDFEMQESSFLSLLNFAISARCEGLHYHIQNVCLNIPDANALVGM
jgi:hypothetical protein